MTPDHIQLTLDTTAYLLTLAADYEQGLACEDSLMKQGNPCGTIPQINKS